MYWIYMLKINSIYKEIYVPPLTTPYLTGNYSNCQFGTNIIVQYFNTSVLDLQKCNSTYNVSSTLTTGVYVTVALKCSGPGNSTTTCSGV